MQKIYIFLERAIMALETSENVAVLLPCYNEGLTIFELVKSFKNALPDAQVYVYDNNSTDNTAQEAARAGAIVRNEPRQGKGNVVRRMFEDIDADLYVMADGDSTYDPSAAPKLIDHQRSNQLAMVVGRRSGVTQDAGRRGHAFGNRIFNFLFRVMFKDGFSDIFSGYRVFTRRFVKSFPALSTGFETETELSVHALMLKLPLDEVEVSYATRPEGSESKLSTFGDGFKILKMFVLLMKEVRPLAFFGLVSILFFILSASFGVPVILEFFRTEAVSRMPSWVLSVGFMLVSILMLAIGLILDSLARSRVEQKRIAYLNQ